MKAKLFIPGLLALMMSFSLASASQEKLSIEQVVERHIQALGGQQKIDAIHTIVYHLTYGEGTLVMPDGYMDHSCLYKVLLHRPTLLDTLCMINAATYAVAAVSGAFDVNIALPRCPSFPNIRITVSSLQIECHNLTTNDKTRFARISFPRSR